MAKIPTDERLLAEIYQRYERAFGEFSDENKTRPTKIWVQIDIDIWLSTPASPPTA
ncbi:MAG: hypothetical protein R3B94_15800 [Hyphomonas sp.]